MFQTIAYPYGEYGLAVGKTVRPAGFTIGFGQHSGVLHSDSEFLFAAITRSTRPLAGKPIEVSVKGFAFEAVDNTPADPFLTPRSNPPAFGFTLTGKKIKKLNQLTATPQMAHD